MLRYFALSTVLAVMTGCATPRFDDIVGQSTSTPVVPDVHPKQDQHNAKKEPELAPDKAAKLCLAAADELEKGGHFAHAIAQCELAQKHQPNLPGLNRKLAGLHAREGELEKAIAAYQQELARSPKDADLLNDLGYCCYQLKDYAAAEKYLRQAVALKPQLHRAQGNLGLALGRQEKWRESLEAFKKAGTNAAAHANLGAMYHAAGRDEDAHRECQIALGLDPKLTAARELVTKLDEIAKEQQAIQQAEAKVMATTTPMVQVAEATPETGVIQLKRPVVTKRPEPEFKPAR